MRSPEQCAVHLIDTTLREGAQAPGVRFSTDQSVEIARALVSIGIDMIECGHPSVSEQEFHRVRSVVLASENTPVLAHARARTDDIDRVKCSGANWVGIFLGVNAISQQTRFTIREPLSEVVRQSVAYAKQIGLNVRFTIEDASRTSWEDLETAFSTALDAGADRICFADTVGCLCPWEAEEIVRRLHDRFVGHSLEVHFHDDRGFANANALIAARVGAAWISSSVNGIGERSGISDTIGLAVNLSALGWRKPVTGALLSAASVVVQSHSRLTVDRWRPFVGHNICTHVAKLHQQATLIDPASYHWIPSATIGKTTCIAPAILPSDLNQLINRSRLISATELRHHRQGPGVRHVMIDDRVVQDARQYCIVRTIPNLDDYGQGHVDTHRHRVDSLFLFLGEHEDLTGLVAEVRLGDATFNVDSPCSVFIPSGVLHSYRVISGVGIFVNHVSAGNYNASLLDEAVIPRSVEPELWSARGFVDSFFRDRLPGIVLDPGQRISDTIDSLLFLDFFVHTEQHLGDSVSLDAIASCVTFEDLYSLLANVRPPTPVSAGASNVP